MGAMMPERNYLESAVQSASPIGMTLLLYDRLMADIRNAIAALQQKDIEKRCGYINHAFMILGHLESELNMDAGGETASNLRQFYGCVRARLLEAQAKLSVDMLQEQIALILQVRQAWQQVEAGSTAPGSEGTVTERASFSCSNMAFQIPEDGPSASSWTA